MTMSTTPAPRSLPEPPGIEATLRSLGCPAFGFAAQPHLAELAATTETSRARVVGVSLSYTYYRHPIYRDHPTNFVDLTLEQSRAVERAEASNLPEWMIEQISRIRYPTLWDAIRTGKAVPGDPKNALELRLTAHANDVRRTTNPHHVPVRAPHAIMTGRVSQADLLESTRVIVDREPHRGRLLDLGAHIVALGARIDNRYLTAVYDRRTAPRIALEFATRRPGARAAST